MNPLISKHPAFLDSSLVFGLTSIAGAAILYRFNPQTDFSFLHCPFHQLTGMNCPGCGTLRAIHSLLHGEVRAALHFNILTVIAVPLLGTLFVEKALQERGQPFPNGTVTESIAPFVPWVVGAFWLLRNIPTYPFSMLSP